jgi:hypothetical protein
MATPGPIENRPRVREADQSWVRCNQGPDLWGGSDFFGSAPMTDCSIMISGSESDYRWRPDTATMACAQAVGIHEIAVPLFGGRCKKVGQGEQ